MKDIIENLNADELAALVEAGKQELEARKASERQDAVTRIMQIAAEYGISVSFPTDVKQPEVITGRKPRAKLPIKYRDDLGNTWTGVGQKPKWMREWLNKGYRPEDFRV